MNTSEMKRSRTSLLARQRYDWILLPALGLFTIVLLSGSTEWLARQLFPRFTTDGEDCIVKDAVAGARGIPHSVCWEKIPEGEPTQYRYNSSGYRANEDFGPKQPGVYRIVLIGTSFTIGMRVPREKTFAATLPAQLSQRAGHPVEIYNEAIPFRFPNTISSHFAEVLEAKPDLILWTLNVGDMRSQGAFPPSDQLRKLSLPMRAWRRMQAGFTSGSTAASMAETFSHTRTATLLSHILYSSQSEYVKSSLVDMGKVPYLQVKPDAEWRQRMEDFEVSAASVVAQARSADVPLVIVLLPNHVQSTMISMGEWPVGLNPYKLNDDLRAIVTGYGGTYLDILPGIRNAPRPDLGYFPFEGHPNARGQAMFSEVLTDQLTTGIVPGLRGTSYLQSELTTGKDGGK